MARRMPFHQQHLAEAAAAAWELAGVSQGKGAPISASPVQGMRRSALVPENWDGTCLDNWAWYGGVSMFLCCFHEDPPPRSCCRIPGCSREGFSLWCSWGGRQAGLHQQLGVGLCVGSATNSQEHSTSTRAQGKTRSEGGVWCLSFCLPAVPVPLCQGTLGCCSFRG